MLAGVLTPCRAAPDGSGRSCGGEDRIVGAALSINPGASSDHPPDAARALAELVGRCPAARADIIRRLALRLAALVRGDRYEDRWSSIDSVLDWIPYREDAQREVDRAAADELETGPALPGSFVFCQQEDITGATRLFAGAPTRSGDLRFGFMSGGVFDRNLTVFGVATRTGSGWEYRADMDRSEAEYRCHLRMEVTRDHGFRLSPVDGAACREDTADGIATNSVEPFTFGNGEREGAVTWQLASKQVFEDLATECRR